MLPDSLLIAECRRLATGADIHDVEGMIGTYVAGCQVIRDAKPNEMSKWQDYIEAARRALRSYTVARSCKHMRTVWQACLDASPHWVNREAERKAENARHAR